VIRAVEEIKLRVLCSIIIPPQKNPAIYEIMWKNIVERGRPQMAIWCMRIACWIPKATNRHSEYVIITALHTARMVTRTRLVVTLHAQYLYTIILTKLIL